MGWRPGFSTFNEDCIFEEDSGQLNYEDYADTLQITKNHWREKVSRGKVYITNASQITLANVQTQMQGEAKKAGFETEDDVVAYIKELRKSRWEFSLIQML